MNLTLLYINSEAVIPAKAGIQPRNTGFRVKPGMTNKGKRFLNHYNSSLVVLKNKGFCVNFILIFILAKVPNKEYKKGEYGHDHLGV